MARYKKKKSNAGLKVLICVLALILVGVCALAVHLTGGNQDPTLQTGDPTHSTPPSGSSEPSTPPTPPKPTGWVKEGDQLFYYTQDSTMVTGAYTIDDKIYCFGTDGALMGSGWQEIDERRYYVQEDGTAYTGWLEEDIYRYYLREDGKAARGKLEIDGKVYYFTSLGRRIDLVNPWNSLPEDYEPDLVKLPDDLGNNRYVERIIYDPLMLMINDCHAAMIERFAGTNKKPPTLFVRSSYRTNRDQEILFDNKVQRVMAANPSLSREEAEIEAAKTVAIPGTSEHQLGIAVDIIDTQNWSLVEEQENLEGQQWLMENCWRYGFILRYPKGTTDITGIIYEPWHYRYVGLELAEEIHGLGITLEEYLDMLTEE